MNAALLAMACGAFFQLATGTPCESVVGHVDDTMGNGHVAYMSMHEVDPDFDYIRYHNIDEGTEVISVLVWDDDMIDVVDRYDVATWTEE